MFGQRSVGGIADPDRPPEYPEEEGEAAVTNLGSGVEGAANLGGADIVVGSPRALR